jgi:hypothetical protein
MKIIPSVLLSVFSLICPLLISGISSAAVTTDSSATIRPVFTSSNIQCKRIVIQPGVDEQIVQGSLNPATPTTCPPGLVPIGVANNAMGASRYSTHEWATDTQGLFPTSVYELSSVGYKYYDLNNPTDNSFNRVDIICVPRTIEFQPEPCPN